MEHNNSYKDKTIKNSILKVYENNRNVLIQSYNINCETLEMPKREDKVYKDIELPHKHTYILAYEMAKRNDEVKKILYALNYLKYIKEDYSKDKEIFINELLSQYPHYLNYEMHNHFLSIGSMRIKDLIDQFEDILKETYLIIPKENKVRTPESSRVLVKSIIHNAPELKEGKLFPKEEAYYKSETLVFDDFTTTTGILKGEKIYDVGVVRPTFNLHIIESNTLDIPININLPTEEIIAYIEKIKENSELIKSPLELLEEELEQIDPENVEKYLAKSFNLKLVAMANALFAYDSFKYRTNKQELLEIKRDELQNKLDDELSKYAKPGAKTKTEKLNIKRITKKYDSQIQDYEKNINDIGRNTTEKYTKISRETGVSVTTVERYLKFMDNYIESLKYRKLFIKTKN